MTQEEALSKIREKGFWDSLNLTEKEALQTLIPELSESEDERIRKWIIGIINEVRDDEDWCVQPKKCDEAIAWLEKKKDANKEYWRGYREGKQEILDKYAEIEKQKEQKQEWSYEDEKQIRQIERIIKDAGCTPTLQEKVHTWFQTICPQPHRKDIREAVDYLRKYATNCVQGGYLQQYVLDLADRIENLLPQPHWKPSGEQMEELNRIINGKAAIRTDFIRTLYNDLKKLM